MFNERREAFRIQQCARLRLVNCTIQARKHQSPGALLYRAESPEFELARLEQQAQRLLAQLETEQPLLARYLQTWEQRLDLLRAQTQLRGNSSAQACQTIDLGSGGFACSPQGTEVPALEPEDRTAFAIELHPEGLLLHGFARVIYRQDEPPRMGLAFEALEEYQQQRLQRHLYARQAQGAPPASR